MSKCSELWIWTLYLLEIFIKMWIKELCQHSYRLWTGWLLFNSRQRSSSFSLLLWPPLWSIHIPILWVPGTLSHDAMWPVHVVEHWPLFSAEVRNAWSCTSAVQYIFMVWCLNMGTVTVMLSVMLLAVCWVTGVWFTGGARTFIFTIIFELWSVLSSLYCRPFTFTSHGFVLRCTSNLPYLYK